MENVTYTSSGALSRQHYALVSKQEQAASALEAERVTWDAYEEIKSRMGKRPRQTGSSSSIANLFAAGARDWGLSLPSSSVAWNPKQTREDLLLLLYCRNSSMESTRVISKDDLQFALPAALTLAEAGKTVDERRTGYLFCSEIISPNHEAHLLIINTVRKDLDSTFVPRILLALDYLISSPNADAIPAVLTRLETLLAYKSPQVRCRALHAFRILGALDPEILHHCLDTLPKRIQDHDISVRIAALLLLEACFERNVVDLKTTGDSLMEIIRSFKFKQSKLPQHQIALVLRAVDILGRIMPNFEADREIFATILFQLGERAGARQAWALVISIFRALSRVPEQEILVLFARRVAKGKDVTHPLSFLHTLLRTKDPNSTRILLQILSVLPAVVWAGGTTNVRMPVDRVSTVFDTGEHTPNENVHAEIDAADLFGESVDKEPPASSLPEDQTETTKVTFAALFDESSVGALIGFLKARDMEIRKLAILVFTKADPSPAGFVSQYMTQLLSALAERQGSVDDSDQRYQCELACQALEVAEVLHSDDGAAYAHAVIDILQRADGHSLSSHPTSPTSSNKSTTSTGTRRSGKGRGGVIEAAVEKVLSTARKDDVFLQSFAGYLLPRHIGTPKGDISVTLLVVTAAIACEASGTPLNTAQILLDSFGQLLTSVSLTIQEMLLLAMLRLSAIEGIQLEEATALIEDLRLKSRKHIADRCLQCLDQISNLPKFRKKLSVLSSMTIPALLSTLEPPRQPEAPRGAIHEGGEPTNLARKKFDPAPLRYTAYEPAEKTAGHSRKPSQSLHTDLLKSRLPGQRQSSSTSKGDDLIQLSILGRSTDRTPTSSLFSGQNENNDNESPFATTISTTLSDLGPPPFLSRTISPPVSPQLSPRRPIHSPLHSPGVKTPSERSPVARALQLQSNAKIVDTEINFDIEWDRLGAQTSTTSRGWFEGEIAAILDMLRKRQSLIKLTTILHDGTEAKLHVRVNNQTGLLRLRQEEDQSTLWLLRSSDSALRGTVKSVLQEN